MSSCRFFGMRVSRIPRLSGTSLVGFSRPQLQPMHPTDTIPKRSKPPSLPGSGSYLSSDSLTGSASRGGFPPCKTARRFTPPSVSVSAMAIYTPPSAVATPASALDPAPSSLPLGVASSSSTTVLSAPEDDGFTTVSSKRRRARTVQATMVGVSSPQPAFSEQEFPAFRIPVQDDFQTSYDAVAALDEVCPTLVMRCLPRKDGSSVILPKSTDTFQHLQDVAVNCSTTRIKLVQLDSFINTTHGVVMGCPLRLPTDLLLRHPQVEEATRCQTTRTKESTRQVTVTLRGPLLPQLSLGSWGTFYLRPWLPEPLQCYRYHRFSHNQVFCANVIKCGICTGSNETIPAPFVWGQQLPTAPPPAQCSAPTDFLPLPPTAAAPRQSLITSLPSRRPLHTTPSTQMIAPLCTTPSSPRIISSPQQVRCTSKKHATTSCQESPSKTLEKSWQIVSPRHSPVLLASPSPLPSPAKQYRQSLINTSTR